MLWNYKSKLSIGEARIDHGLHRALVAQKHRPIHRHKKEVSEKRDS